MADPMVGRIGGTAIGVVVTGKRVSFAKDNSLAKEKPGGDSGLFVCVVDLVYITARPARVQAYASMARRGVRFPAWS
jgi:hypothetical protein